VGRPARPRLRLLGTADRLYTVASPTMDEGTWDRDPNLWADISYLFSFTSVGLFCFFFVVVERGIAKLGHGHVPRPGSGDGHVYKPVGAEVVEARRRAMRGANCTGSSVSGVEDSTTVGLQHRML